MSERTADVVLVGAPGSATRAVALALAQIEGRELLDVDALVAADPDHAGEVLGSARAGDHRPRVMIADSAIADPRIRMRLYRGRRVVWQDAPVDRLVARVRVDPGQPFGLGPDLPAVLEGHLAAMIPYYAAGRRIDASGSTASIAEAVLAVLDEPDPPGTLVVRADTAVGLMEVGEGIVARGIRDALSGLHAYRAAVMTDATTWRHAGEGISAALREASVPFVVVEVPAGERAKTVDAQATLLRELTRHHLGRQDPIVAFGDDRVCEATTFTAGVYLRGVPLITAPTTMLGQIDLGIGGKGSVNLDAGRNLLGIFHQPVGAVIDIDLLRDEDPRERHSAMAEAVKYALLGDEGVFAILDRMSEEAHGDRLSDDDLLELVERCALAKLRLVVADERDTAGARIALNLGHTLSHALETATNYELLHGEAVAYGLRAALLIGVELGETPLALAEHAQRVLDALDLGTRRLEIDPRSLVRFIAADKKRERGRLRWVLARGPGIAIRADVPDAVVARAVYSAVGGTASA